jgi:hypothetical protein
MKPFAACSIAAAILLGSPWLAESKAHCGICHRDKCNTCKAQPTACSTCGSPQISGNACAPACQPVQCCHKEKVSYTTQRTRYKLVKECVPVCKTKYEHRQDPCDPCKKTKVPVTYWENKTHYRWVSYCEPVCHTKTVKVCNWVTPGTNAPMENAPAVEEETQATPQPTVNERQAIF